MGDVVNIYHTDHFRNIDLCFLRQLLVLTSKLKKMTTCKFECYFVSDDFWTSIISRLEATKGILQTLGIGRK